VVTDAEPEMKEKREAGSEEKNKKASPATRRLRLRTVLGPIWLDILALQ
jgi:hypothetical protein